MKQFEVPAFYRSPLLSKIKAQRKLADPRKKDFSPTTLQIGKFTFLIARHFGFCYGVENAIERSYKALQENPGKRIFLLSQMIHNPAVNADLTGNGIQFLQDTHGKQLIAFDTLTPNDIVLIPAFGTTLEIEQQLTSLGLDIQTYNTTCPFVEKVWNRSEKLGETQHTIIIHGKHDHEETRATFSHAVANGPALIVKDMKEAEAVLLKGHLTEPIQTQLFDKNGIATAGLKTIQLNVKAFEKLANTKINWNAKQVKDLPLSYVLRNLNLLLLRIRIVQHTNH